MARLTATDAAGRVYTRFSETFTLKHNAVRAARRSLGAGAQPGSDFALEQTVDGWTWRVEQHEEALAHRPDKGQQPAAIELVDHGRAEAPAPIAIGDAKTVDELLRRIAAENGQIASRLMMQALHTAFAEGTVAQRPSRARGRRRPLFLLNEPLTVPEGIRPN